MSWEALHRNTIFGLTIAICADAIESNENFDIRKMLIQTPEGIESNGGLSIFPKKEEQGQIIIKYFPMEREAVILAKEGPGHEFAQRIKERCAGIMPAVDCSVLLRCVEQREGGTEDLR